MLFLCCWFSDKKIRRKETVVDFCCCCSIINSFQHKSVYQRCRDELNETRRRPSRWSFAPRRPWLASRIRADFLCRAEQPWRLLASLDSDHSTETAKNENKQQNRISELRSEQWISAAKKQRQMRKCGSALNSLVLMLIWQRRRMWDSNGFEEYPSRFRHRPAKRSID